jgi:hypothetical protein
MHAPFDPAEQAGAHVKARDQILHAQDGRGFGAHRILRLERLGLHLIGGLGAQQIELARQIAALHGPQARHGGQQGAGVAMARRCKHRFAYAFLDTFASVHHQHTVGHFCDHAHVVGDEDHAHLHLVLQSADQLQDLRLNGHVQRRGGFVGNQQ